MVSPLLDKEFYPTIAIVVVDCQQQYLNVILNDFPHGL
jgi:hypothetical protein